MEIITNRYRRETGQSAYKFNWFGRRIHNQSYIDWLEKQCTIPVVSQRSELFAEQDSKEFKDWQKKNGITKVTETYYKWSSFKFQREFFLEKYLEDKNKANCG